MTFLNTKRITLQLKNAIAWSLIATMVIFVGCYCFFVLVKVKRGQDLIGHAINKAHQIEITPMIQTYLIEDPDRVSESQVQSFLQSSLLNDPFIEEIDIISKSGKRFFNIKQELLHEEENTAPRAALSLSEVIRSGQPKHVETSGETFVPLSMPSQPDWGILRIRWLPKATWKFYEVLQLVMIYISIGTFLITFVLSYFVFQRSHAVECDRMAKKLSLIVGGDYSQRVETSRYSPGISEIGTYVNRVLSKSQEAQKQSAILHDTLRQLEKGNSDYRKALGDRSAELDTLRNEMREGILILFELLWHGILIIDEEYRIHYINEQAEGLLRFAKFDDTFIVDERVKKCLAPLIRTNIAERVDDLCVWPQRTLGHSVSCRIRAAAIPTGDGTKMYFILLREECGFPKHRGSSYFSERLVMDILSHANKEPDLILADSLAQIEKGFLESRFKECLRKIEKFKELEEGSIGPISAIRLPIWLHDHFQVEAPHHTHLNIDTKASEMDIVLHLPEQLLAEFVDTVMLLISYHASQDDKQSTRVAIRTSINAKGHPVIAFIIPQIKRKLALNLQDQLEEKSGLISDEEVSASLTLEDLENDLSFSLFRLIRRLMKFHVEFVYSENKKMATIRITIDHLAFSQTIKETPLKKSDKEPVVNLVREYLSGY